MDNLNSFRCNFLKSNCHYSFLSQWRNRTILGLSSGVELASSQSSRPLRVNLMIRSPLTAVLISLDSLFLAVWSIVSCTWRLTTKKKTIKWQWRLLSCVKKKFAAKKFDYRCLIIWNNRILNVNKKGIRRSK